MWRLGREKDFFSVEKEGSKREEACAAKRPGQSGKYAAAPSAAATEAGAWRVRVDLHAFTFAAEQPGRSGSIQFW